MSQRATGRPRAFDRDEAVLAAARLFWRVGYSGTSTRALSSALGLSMSSIYAAFGSKAALFEEAVRTYAERYREIYQQACEEPEITGVVERLFTLSVEEFTRPSDRHPGCLISSAVMSDGPDTIDTRAYINELQGSSRQLLLARIHRATKDHQVAPDVDVTALTGLIEAIWHGLSMQSNQGVSRPELLTIASTACDAVQTRFLPKTS